MAELEVRQLLLDAVVAEKDPHVLCVADGLVGWEGNHSELRTQPVDYHTGIMLSIAHNVPGDVGLGYKSPGVHTRLLYY